MTYLTTQIEFCEEQSRSSLTESVPFLSALTMLHKCFVFDVVWTVTTLCGEHHQKDSVKRRGFFRLETPLLLPSDMTRHQDELLWNVGIECADQNLGLIVTPEMARFFPLPPDKRIGAERSLMPHARRGRTSFGPCEAAVAGGGVGKGLMRDMLRVLIIGSCI